MTEQDREWNQLISTQERTTWRTDAQEPTATLLARYEFTLARCEMRLQQAAMLLSQLQYLTAHNRNQFEAIADFLAGY